MRGRASKPAKLFGVYVLEKGKPFGVAGEEVTTGPASSRR